MRLDAGIFPLQQHCTSTDATAQISLPSGTPRSPRSTSLSAGKRVHGGRSPPFPAPTIDGWTIQVADSARPMTALIARFSSARVPPAL